MMYKEKFIVFGGFFMKKNALFISIFCLAFSVFAEDSVAVFKPAGNVSSYTRTIYSVSSRFGDYFRTVSKKEVHEMKNGLETEVSLLSAKDELIQKSSWVYNANGTIKTLSVTDAEKEVKHEYEYTADLKIGVITAKDLNTEEITSKTIYKYEDGKITEDFYDEEGKLLTRKIRTLDPSGNIAEETSYNGDGTFSFLEKYSFNEAKKISSIETFDEDSNCTKKTVFQYDENGFLTEIQIYNEGKITERRLCKNDALGNPTRISFYDVVDKFDKVVYELKRIDDFTYSY